MSDPPTSPNPTRLEATGRTFSTVGFLLLALAPVGLAGVSCVVRPNALAALVLVPPWFWVLSGVPAMAWALRSRRRCWVIGLAVIWTGFVLGYVEEAASLSRSVTSRLRSLPPQAKIIRVVSLNCANTVRCIEDLQAARPDIALLQEIPGPEELQQIARTLFGDEGVFLAGHDTAIVARGRIEPQKFDAQGALVSGIVTLPEYPSWHCICVRRTPPVFRLDCWAPGFWTDHQARRETHRQEAVEIRNALNAVDEMPRIVGGDFNTPPLDPTLELLRPTVRDAFLTSGVGLGGTGTNDFPLFRVDQIWCSTRPIRTFAQKTKHSDHRMVVCDLVSPE